MSPSFEVVKMESRSGDKKKAGGELQKPTIYPSTDGPKLLTAVPWVWRAACSAQAKQNKQKKNQMRAAGPIKQTDTQSRLEHLDVFKEVN